MVLNKYDKTLNKTQGHPNLALHVGFVTPVIFVDFSDSQGVIMVIKGHTQ